jgi:hypothetical protein
MRNVEILSAIDRDSAQVVYWTIFEGRKSLPTTAWQSAVTRAEEIVMHNPGVTIIDRSDKDSGILAAMLGKSDSTVSGQTRTPLPGFESAVTFGFNVEPDGKFSWALLAADGTLLQSGIGDVWDDILLTAISNVQPPSGEQ